MKIRCRRSSKNKGFILIPVMISAALLLAAAAAFSWFARTEMKRAEAVSFSIISRGLLRGSSSHGQAMATTVSNSRVTAVMRRVWRVALFSKTNL